MVDRRGRTLLYYFAADFLGCLGDV